jgi:hypothetical protein
MANRDVQTRSPPANSALRAPLLDSSCIVMVNISFSKTSRRVDLERVVQMICIHGRSCQFQFWHKIAIQALAFSPQSPPSHKSMATSQRILDSGVRKCNRREIVEGIDPALTLRGLARRTPVIDHDACRLRGSPTKLRVIQEPLSMRPRQAFWHFAAAPEIDLCPRSRITHSGTVSEMPLRSAGRVSGQRDGRNARCAATTIWATVRGR